MNISRRNFMQVMGAAALAGPLGSAGRALAAGRDKELNILCWEGYNSAQVLDPFRADKGATVKAESLTNDPTMINRLRAGETKIWDLINVNNPWARKIMAPAGLIKPLPKDEFEPFFDTMLPEFKAPYRWAMSDDGKDLLGMAQRFGPYSFVVNTDKISRATAEEQGWNLFNDASLAGKYGIQESDDWNVFNIFMIAGINPFMNAPSHGRAQQNLAVIDEIQRDHRVEHSSLPWSESPVEIKTGKDTSELTTDRNGVLRINLLDSPFAEQDLSHITQLGLKVEDEPSNVQATAILPLSKSLRGKLLEAHDLIYDDLEDDEVSQWVHRVKRLSELGLEEEASDLEQSLIEMTRNDPQLQHEFLRSLAKDAGRLVAVPVGSE